MVLSNLVLLIIIDYPTVQKIICCVFQHTRCVFIDWLFGYYSDLADLYLRIG